MVNLVYVSGEDSKKSLKINNDGSINTTISDGSGNSAALVNNPQENQYELVANLRGHICEDNTSTTPLGISGVFTGDWQDTIDYINIAVGITTDQDSATDGLEIQWSSDGITVHDEDVFSILANKGKIFTFQPARRYVRLKYTNGTVAQTSFNLETRLSRVQGKPSSHRIADPIVADDDAELVKAVNTGLSPDGTFKNVNVTNDGDLSISDNSSGLSIAQGNVTGVTYVHKFGNAPDFDTTDGQITIWDGAEDGTAWENMVYDYSTSADIDRLSSSDNSDTQDIEIQGLDGNYDLVVQTITLTGQTPAILTTPLLRVFRMKNVNTVNLAGHVFCFVNVATTLGVPNTPANIRAIIQPGNNQTLMSIYTVPAGKTAYLDRFWSSVAGANKASNYVIDLFERPFGGVFQLKNKNSISDNGTSFLSFEYNTPEEIAEKSDIEIRATAQAVGVTAASISSGFDLTLKDN